VHVVLGFHSCAAPAARRRAPEPQEQRGSGGSERRPPRGGSNRDRVARADWRVVDVEAEADGGGWGCGGRIGIGEWGRNGWAGLDSLAWLQRGS
jgi:hypothetical protein